MKIAATIVSATPNTIAGKDYIDALVRFEVNGSRRNRKPSDLAPEDAASFKNKPATLEVSDAR